MSNPNNVIGGHKANLNNPSSSLTSLYKDTLADKCPDTSEESKQHSKEVLGEQGVATSSSGSNTGSSGNSGSTSTSGSSGSSGDDSGKNPNNVAGGLKAYVQTSVNCYRHD